MGPRPDTLLDLTELGSFNDESKGSRELATSKVCSGEVERCNVYGKCYNRSAGQSAQVLALLECVLSPAIISDHGLFKGYVLCKKIHSAQASLHHSYLFPYQPLMRFFLAPLSAYAVDLGWAQAQLDECAKLLLETRAGSRHEVQRGMIQWWSWWCFLWFHDGPKRSLNPWHYWWRSSHEWWR